MVNAKSKTVDKAYLEAINNYIGAEIVLAGKYAIHVLDKVKKPKYDANNLTIVDANSNPVLVTLIYELEFPVGRIEIYYVNVIAENLLNMSNANGVDTDLLEK